MLKIWFNYSNVHFLIADPVHSIFTSRQISFQFRWTHNISSGTIFSLGKFRAALVYTAHFIRQAEQFTFGAHTCFLSSFSQIFLRVREKQAKFIFGPVLWLGMYIKNWFHLLSWRPYNAMCKVRELNAAWHSIAGWKFTYTYTCTLPAVAYAQYHKRCTVTHMTVWIPSVRSFDFSFHYIHISSQFSGSDQNISIRACISFYPRAFRTLHLMACISLHI